MEIANTENVMSGQYTQAHQPSVAKTGEKTRQDAQAPAPESAGDAEKQQLASVQALVAGLRGDFAEIGLVPPPKKYAGLDVVSQGEIAQARSDGTPAAVGALDRMRIIMVRSILARLASEQAVNPDETPDTPDSTAHVNLAL